MAFSSLSSNWLVGSSYSALWRRLARGRTGLPNARRVSAFATRVSCWWLGKGPPLRFHRRLPGYCSAAFAVNLLCPYWYMAQYRNFTIHLHFDQWLKPMCEFSSRQARSDQACAASVQWNLDFFGRPWILGRVCRFPWFSSFAYRCYVLHYLFSNWPIALSSILFEIHRNLAIYFDLLACCVWRFESSELGMIGRQKCPNLSLSSWTNHFPSWSPSFCPTLSLRVCDSKCA